ncbi:MAG: immunoglobulin domain-containing protein, partial [Odoribacter sp.]
VKKITGSTADYAVFYIDKDSRVMVQMTVQPENCVSRDICDVRIGVKDARKYQGGAADGFSLARPSLRLWKKDTAVCVYTPLRAQLVDFKYPTYYFEWYKVGEESKPPVCQTKDLLIPRCRMEDAGNYYCRVKDVDGSGYIYSDTLALTVKDGPIAKIVVPSGGTELCYRQSLTLEAVSKNSAYQYEWNGADIEGGRLSSDLEIRPRQSGLYVLKISDVLGCSSVDSIRVGVREALKLDLPEQWSLAQPGALSLTAWSNRPNLSLNWKWEGKRQSGGHTMNLSLTKAGVVSVSLEDGKCAVSDSCRVDIKQVTTFRGGESDGFEESVPVLKVMEKVMERCTGEQAVLKVGGMNYPNCEYKWYRADDATVAVGSGRTYTIAFCELVHSGLYFCQANRGSEPIWNSDTVSLTVNQGAVAKIVKDPAGMTACYGVQKTLTAEVVDGNYEWSGAGILGGRLSSNLVLLPRKSGIYTLRVTRGECSTSDSVALKVIHPFVRIPDLLQLSAGQEVTMNAERSHPDTLVKWSVNNVYQLTSNKSVALSIAGSGLVVAEVTEQGCQASDTMQVFVKGGSTFTAGGGGNDGFAVSRALLRVKVKELTPCETSDVLMALQDDNVGYHSYTWYKVGELAAVGQGMSYAILRCTAGYNGQYYCRAESADAAGYSYSDTLSLQVKPGVATTIISPTKGTGLCYGEEVIFQAQPQGSGYTYHWTGAGIVEGGDSPIVTVKVEKAGQMRLDMTYNGCESMDTVSFTVTRPEVALQKTMLLSA